MTVILGYETSSDQCSIGLKVKSQIFTKTIAGHKSHTEHLFPLTEVLLKESGIELSQVDAFAFSAGPGSFTGIRIGASASKALAYALKKPVLAINSLSVTAKAFCLVNPTTSIKDIIVVNDARMNECYIGKWPADKTESSKQPEMDLIKYENLSTALPDNKSVVGDAGKVIEKFAPEIACRNQLPSAEALLALAQEALMSKHAVDPLIAEPIYLRGRSAWKTVSEQKANRNG